MLWAPFYPLIVGTPYSSLLGSLPFLFKSSLWEISLSPWLQLQFICWWLKIYVSSTDLPPPKLQNCRSKCWVGISSGTAWWSKWNPSFSFLNLYFLHSLCQWTLSLPGAKPETYIQSWCLPHSSLTTTNPFTYINFSMKTALKSIHISPTPQPYHSPDSINSLWLPQWPLTSPPTSRYPFSTVKRDLSKMQSDVTLLS